MTDKYLSTESYKGVRDFYPKDAAIQQYIFDTWRKTAESFGFERYDASILEPSDLYKAKGAENEELVNEQTYTFTDRGDRQVTLRPEMTPTVARMVAAKARELAFPLRWYSIPNLFRYERPQKGRLREHWQLNCDIFGSDNVVADVEIIALAYQTLINFGARTEHFQIRINHRKNFESILKMSTGGVESIAAIHAFDNGKYEDSLKKLMGIFDSKKTFKEKGEALEQMNIPKSILTDKENMHIETNKVLEALSELNITNVIFDPNIARGFDYYTGTIFEIFEVDTHGNSIGRAILGGGRYDNLTSMFGGDPISGVGFGMGDVTMRDFLETHNLIPDSVLSTTIKVTIIPETAEQNLFAQKIAQEIRQSRISVVTDIGTQKTDKKKSRANEKGTKFIMTIGENEVETGILTIKNLETNEETSGSVSVLLQKLS